MPTNAYHPIIANLTEERKNFQSPDIALNYLQNVSLSLPNKHLSEETALNLTEVKLFEFCAGGIRDGKLPDVPWSTNAFCLPYRQLQKNQELLHKSLDFRLVMNN